MIDSVKGERYWRGPLEWRDLPRKSEAVVSVSAAAPSRVESGLHGASGVIDAVGGVLSVYSLGKDLAGAIRAEKPAEKAKLSVKVVVHAASATGSAGGIASSLEKLGLVARAAAAWTAVLGYILMPFQAIGLTINLYDTVQHGRCLHKLNKADRQASQEMRLLSGLEAVKERDEPRIQAVMRRIQTSQGAAKTYALKEGEKLLALFKTQVKKDLALSVAKAALGIAGVALGIFAIIATGGLALVAAGAALGLVGVGVSIYKHIHDKEKQDEKAKLLLEDTIRRDAIQEYMAIRSS